MNSLNHYAYGAVGDWMYRTIAGVRLNLIDPDAPSLTLNPRPDPRLGHCSASLDSPVGRIESRWRYTDLKIEFELTVPIEATLRIESVTENRIGPGSHRFTVDRSDAIFSSTP
ncbi:MAG: alpha-L-rhamnosidase C-terminal domain-containing protein [bacterium]